MKIVNKSAEAAADPTKTARADGDVWSREIRNRVALLFSRLTLLLWIEHHPHIAIHVEILLR